MAKIKNNIEFHEGYAVIVGGGKYGGRFIIDLEDAERVLQHKWNKSTLGDVQSRINGKIVVFLKVFSSTNTMHWETCCCRKTVLEPRIYIPMTIRAGR